MYSWEIENELKANDYILTGVRMNDIKDESCQIKRLKLLNMYNDHAVYEMLTADNYRWEIRVNNL